MRGKHRARKDRVTLDRVFSKWGICSRRDAQNKIRAGMVSVNGKEVRDPDFWVTLTQDKVKCEGGNLKPRKKLYYMLYKPKGVVTTYRDPDNRRTVYHLFTGIKDWIFPVGRLDSDTSGLLLLTNDTHFSETLTNPLSRIPKTYQLKINFYPSAEQLQLLEQGITLNDGPTLPARVRVLRTKGKYTYLEIAIVEGKNRQVRRMIDALNGKVLKLVRTRIGNLALGDLQVGKYRQLDSNDLRELTSQRRKV